MDPERPISWMAIRPNWRVMDKDGDDIGHVEEVLGAEGEDIFHGLAVNLKGWGGHVEVPADHITKITEEHIHTDLTLEEAKALEGN